MDKWVDANKSWVAADIKADVEAFGKMLSDHREDIKRFGDELLTVVGVAGQIAVAFAAQGPAAQALEVFAALIGTRILGPLNLARAALGMGLINPATLGAGAVVALLASGDPNKAMLDGGTPDANPRQDDLGLPGMDNDKDLPENKSPSDPAGPKNAISGLWSWVKTTANSLGFGDKNLKDSRTKDDQVHDDNRVKDDIADTAKSTAKLVDLVKGQQDATVSNASPVTVSSGGLGGSGRHSGGGSSPGASLGDRSGAHGSAAASGTTAVAQDLTPEARAFLDTTASGESPAYNVMNGGGKFDSYAQHPQPYKGGRAAGQYQFLGSTWLGIQKETGLKDFSPENQDKGAWYLARRDYRLHTGRDLQTDLASKDPARVAAVGQALHSTWVSFNSSFAGKYQKYLARNGTQPTAQAPVPAGTSSHAIGDAEAFAAHQRTVNGSRDPKDKSLYDHYLAQQNVPKHHQTIRDALDILRDARKLTHHGGTPIKVSLDRGSAQHIAMLAAAHRGALHGGTSNVDRRSTSETNIAELHVHSQARDAGSIARDMHAALIAKREAADKGNYGLA